MNHNLYEQTNFNMNNLQYMQPQAPQPPQPPASASSKKIKKDRACDLCRRKKVRCNYDYNSPENQCMTCKNYNKICTFNEAAKKRGPPKGYVEKLENRLKRIENTLTNIAQSGNLPPELLNELLQDESINNDNSRETQKSAKKAKTKSAPALPSTSSAGKQKVTNIPENSESLSYLGSSSGFYMLKKLFSQSSIPAFRDQSIFSQPLDGHEDDMMVLRPSFDNPIFAKPIQKPSWKPPPKELMDHLITLYFTHLNTVLPIIDESDFYASYHRGTIDMQLIISICRATCRSLKRDHPLLKKFNIDSIDLFKDLSKQMADYFNLDFLKPDIQTVQILLLNSSNAENWEMESHYWILTSIAVKMAQDLGLHRSNATSKCTARKDYEFKKRLWWSIVCVDRWVCAALGRPLTISDADCDVEYPETEGTKYTCFLQMVKLSCILGEVLRSICSPRSRILSEKGIKLEQVSSNLELLLQEWKYSLPADLNLTDEELSRISRGESDPELTWKINNGGGRLLLCYYTIFLTIKRPILASCDATLPHECQNAISTLVHLLDAIDVTQLLYGWSLSSHCISQTQILLFLYEKNKMDFRNAILESVFKRFHSRLSEYIKKRSIVPFLDALSKVLNQVDANSESSSISIHQPYLWSMSNNTEWEAMFKLLAETGYQH